jgi:gluconokinase
MLYRAIAPEVAPGHRVVANGGALLNSPAWQRIVCDAIGTPLTMLSKDEESSARGAALIALDAAGVLASFADADDPAAGQPVLQPDAAATVAYAAAADRQRDFAGCLADGVWWR